MNQDVLRDFESEHQIFLMKQQKDVLGQFLLSLDPKQYMFYCINLHEYLDRWPQLYVYFKEKKLSLFKKIMIEQLIQAQSSLLRQKKGSQCFVKDRIYVYLVNIPAVSSFRVSSISNLLQEQVNKLALIRGTVIQTGEIKALVLEQQIQCTQCDQISTIESDAADCHRLQFPLECDNIVEKVKKNNFFIQMMMKKYKKKENVDQNSTKTTIKAPGQGKCGSKKFALIQGTEHLIDYQEIKVQDSFSDNVNGNAQRSVRVILYGQLINTCKAGDTVSVGGIILQKWLKSNKNQRPIIQQMIDCQQIHRQNIKQSIMSIPDHRSEINRSSNDDQEDILFRQRLIESTCPHIFQRQDLKLAILLCIVGGVTTSAMQTQIRGNSHLLLVGEPGTGKSSILKYVSMIAPKAVYTNGIGSTSAGLTLSYVKEGSEWMIQAGAMVLADQGVCCIDEFNLIQKPQLESILEALEQQTVSSSKAGLQAKLNARTSLVAACNPIGPGQRYSQSMDLMQNTGLSSPLISRFDLVFVLVDEINEEKDAQNSSFILQKYMGEEQTQRQNIYHESQLRDYLAFVRETYSPTLSDEAQQILSRYYIKLRQKHSNITVRLLESLIRLTQAHSKLMKRDVSSSFDAISVLMLVESTGCQSLGLMLTPTPTLDAYLQLRQYLNDE